MTSHMPIPSNMKLVLIIASSLLLIIGVLGVNYPCRSVTITPISDVGINRQTMQVVYENCTPVYVHYRCGNKEYEQFLRDDRFTINDLMSNSEHTCEANLKDIRMANISQLSVFRFKTAQGLFIELIQPKQMLITANYDVFEKDGQRYYLTLPRFMVYIQHSPTKLLHDVQSCQQLNIELIAVQSTREVVLAKETFYSMREPQIWIDTNHTNARVEIELTDECEANVGILFCENEGYKFDFVNNYANLILFQLYSHHQYQCELEIEMKNGLTARYKHEFKTNNATHVEVSGSTLTIHLSHYYEGSYDAFYIKITDKHVINSGSSITVSVSSSQFFNITLLGVKNSLEYDLEQQQVKT